MRWPSLSDTWQLVRDAVSSWIDDYAPSMGAALAYYTMFSLAPVLLIAISVAGLVFGEEAARGEIYAQLRSMMGAEGAMAVQGLLESVRRPTEGVAATVAGVGVLVIGATTVFGELQDALDRIWRAPARVQHSGLWALLRSRLLSFGMVLGIGFMLIVSLVASAALSALASWWAPVFGGWEVLARVVNFIISFALITTGFAMIYKYIPRVRIAWRDVFIGALVTGLLFTFGKTLIGLYIGTSGIGSTFGAAASLIVVVVWVYYSAQIFLLGAEFTWVYAQRYGSRRGKADESAPAATPMRSQAPAQRA